MIEDHKLQAVSFSPESLPINYGSKEDDDRALDTLSELFNFIPQTQEFFASEIIRSLEFFSKVKLSLIMYSFDFQKVKYFYLMNLWTSMQTESSSIREQLLEEFSPDDMCQLGSRLTVNMPEKVCQVDFCSDRFSVELITIIFPYFLSLYF